MGIHVAQKLINGLLWLLSLLLHPILYLKDLCACHIWLVRSHPNGFLRHAIKIMFLQ